MSFMNYSISSTNTLANIGGTIKQNGFKSYDLVPAGNVVDLTDKISDIVDDKLVPVNSEIATINTNANNIQNAVTALSDNLTTNYLATSDITNYTGEIISSINESYGTFVTQDQAGQWYGLRLTTDINGVEYVSGFDTGAITNPNTGVTDSYFRINADSFIVGSDLGDGEFSSTGGPVFSITTGDTGTPELFFNGRVNISGVPEAMSKYAGAFANETDLNLWLAANPDFILSEGDTYLNTTDDIIYMWDGAVWQNLKGQDGDRGSAILSYEASGAFNASVASSLFINKYGALVTGDQLVWTDDRDGVGGTGIYEWTGTNWTYSVALRVNGNAIIDGTLAASSLIADSITGLTINGAYGNFTKSQNTPAGMVPLYADGGNNTGMHGRGFVGGIFTGTFYGIDTQGTGNGGGIRTTTNSAYEYGILARNTAGGGILGSGGAGRFEGHVEVTETLSTNNLSYSGSFNPPGGVFNLTSAGNTITGTTTGAIAYGVAGISNSGAEGRLGFLSYGLYTSGNASIGGSTYPFTGAHISYSDTDIAVGDIIVSEKSSLDNINQSKVLSKVSSIVRDKRVFGVVSETTEDNGVYQIGANAVGEGGINVCEVNGDIENGDYICSSNVEGKGMRQDDDLLHNYTVAKSLEDVVWDNEIIGKDGCFDKDGVKCKTIACTYHCG